MSLECRQEEEEPEQAWEEEGPGWRTAEMKMGMGRNAIKEGLGKKKKEY